jgi:hypothetical protein
VLSESVQYGDIQPPESIPPTAGSSARIEELPVITNQMPKPK